NAPDSFTNTHATANTFSVVGLRPLIGRDFTPEHARQGAAPVAILTDALWQKRYGKDPSIVGQRSGANTVPTTSIGLSAPALAIPPEPELWTPYIPDAKEKRQNRNLTVSGKLAAGVSQTAARSEVSLVGQRLATQYPDTNKDLRYLIQNFTELTVRGP